MTEKNSSDDFRYARHKYITQTVLACFQACSLLELRNWSLIAEICSAEAIANFELLNICKPNTLQQHTTRIVLEQKFRI